VPLFWPTRRGGGAAFGLGLMSRLDDHGRVTVAERRGREQVLVAAFPVPQVLPGSTLWSQPHRVWDTPVAIRIGPAAVRAWKERWPTVWPEVRIAKNELSPNTSITPSSFRPGPAGSGITGVAAFPGACGGSFPGQTGSRRAMRSLARSERRVISVRVFERVATASGARPWRQSLRHELADHNPGC
jgi:hypothetical protein